LLTKKTGLNTLLKRAGAANSVSSMLLQRVVDKVKDIPEDDPYISNSDNANLIRELKLELENQSSAKQKALNILQKLKNEGK